MIKGVCSFKAITNRTWRVEISDKVEIEDVGKYIKERQSLRWDTLSLSLKSSANFTAPSNLSVLTDNVERSLKMLEKYPLRGESFTSELV